MCICDCNVNVWGVCDDGAHRKTRKTLCFVIVYLLPILFLSVCLFPFLFLAFLFSFFSIYYCFCLVIIFMLSPSFAHLLCSHNNCCVELFFLSRIAPCLLSFALSLFPPRSDILFSFSIASLHFQFSQDLKFFKLIFISYLLNKIFATLENLSISMRICSLHGMPSPPFAFRNFLVCVFCHM